MFTSSVFGTSHENMSLIFCVLEAKVLGFLLSDYKDSLGKGSLLICLLANVAFCVTELHKIINCVCSNTAWIWKCGQACG
jgi:hypothetical protein